MKHLGTIIIPYWRPSTVNELGGPQSHFTVKAEKQRVEMEAWAQCNKLRIKHAQTKRKIHVEILKPVPKRGTAKRCDRDNRHSMMKVILDGLSRPKGRKTIGASIIVDDDDEFVDWSIEEHLNCPRLETQIHIYE